MQLFLWRVADDRKPIKLELNGFSLSAFPCTCLFVRNSCHLSTASPRPWQLIDPLMVSVSRAWCHFQTGREFTMLLHFRSFLGRLLKFMP